MSIHPEDIQRVKGQGFLRNKGTDCFNARILTTNGNVSTEQIRAIAEAADRFGCGRVQFTSRMTVELPGIPPGGSSMTVTAPLPPKTNFHGRTRRCTETTRFSRSMNTRSSG